MNKKTWEVYRRLRKRTSDKYELVLSSEEEVILKFEGEIIDKFSDMESLLTTLIKFDRTERDKKSKYRTIKGKIISKEEFLKKQKKEDIEIDKVLKFKDGETSNNHDDHDPYENFHWGGLSGEEAYIGYLNSQ